MLKLMLKLKLFHSRDFSVAKALLSIYFTLKSSEKTMKEFIFSKVIDLQFSNLLRNDFYFRYFEISQVQMVSSTLNYIPTTSVSCNLRQVLNSTIGVLDSTLFNIWVLGPRSDLRDSGPYLTFFRYMLEL